MSSKAFGALLLCLLGTMACGSKGTKAADRPPQSSGDVKPEQTGALPTKALLLSDSLQMPQLNELSTELVGVKGHAI